MQKLRGILAVFAFYTVSSLGFAQPGSYQHIDGIIGVVGNEIILSSELDESGSTNKKNCYKVGTGVLSKLVIFGKKLYANISGETEEDKKLHDRYSTV